MELNLFSIKLLHIYLIVPRKYPVNVLNWSHLTYIYIDVKVHGKRKRTLRRGVCGTYKVTSLCV